MTKLVQFIVGSEIYMCCSMKIEKNAKTLSNQQCREWTRETMGKSRVKFLLVSSGVHKLLGVQIHK